MDAFGRLVEDEGLRPGHQLGRAKYPEIGDN